MININEEKERVLTAQDCYDILAVATNATLIDCGYLNSFMFSHIMYVLAVKSLLDEVELDIASEDWLGLWQACVENGFLEEALESFPEEMTYLAHEAEIWQQEYTGYANSARSAMDGIAMVIQDTVKNLQTILKDPSLKRVLDTANDWGINNNPEEEELS